MNPQETPTDRLVEIVRERAEQYQKPESGDPVWSELMSRYSWFNCPKEDRTLISGLDALLRPLNGGRTMLPPLIRYGPDDGIPLPPLYYRKIIPLSQSVGIIENGTSIKNQMPTKSQRTVKAFISYSHKDADHLAQLHEHLAALRRQKLLDAWTDKEIHAGGDIDGHIHEQIEQAEIYLLLVSSSFIESNYCFEKEFARAIERQKAGEAIIVPIIVRECDWKIPELRRFKALPEDGTPIISRHWHSPDEAFANVAKGLRKLLESNPFEKPKPRRKTKAAKDKFSPTEIHITEEQRAELRKLVDEIVDRLTARIANEPDDVVGKRKGKFFGIVWSQFNKEFGTVENGLPSLPKESFDEAKSWLMQYRASKNKNLKRINPQKYRNTLTKTIHTIAGKLGWTDADLRSFAAEKLGLEAPIDGLSGLGNSQLELVRDRVRYEATKRKVKASQGKKPVKKKPAFHPLGFVTSVLDAASQKAKAINCINNLKQLGLSARIWSRDHNDILPSDLVSLGEISPVQKILHCSDNQSAKYVILSPGAPSSNPTLVYAKCPIHDHIVLVDGSVHRLENRSLVQKATGWVVE